MSQSRKKHLKKAYPDVSRENALQIIYFNEQTPNIVNRSLLDLEYNIPLFLQPGFVI